MTEDCLTNCVHWGHEGRVLTGSSYLKVKSWVEPSSMSMNLESPIKRRIGGVEKLREDTCDDSAGRCEARV